MLVSPFHFYPSIIPHYFVFARHLFFYKVEGVRGWSFLRGTFSEERFLSDSPPNLLGLREPVCGADMGEKGKGEEFLVEYGLNLLDL